MLHYTAFGEVKKINNKKIISKKKINNSKQRIIEGMNNTEPRVYANTDSTNDNNVDNRNIGDIALDCGISPPDLENYLNMPKDTSVSMYQNVSQGMNITSYGLQVKKCMQDAIENMESVDSNETDKIKLSINGRWNNNISKEFDDKPEIYIVDESQAYSTNSNCEAKDKCVVEINDKSQARIRMLDRCKSVQGNYPFSDYISAGETIEKNGCSITEFMSIPGTTTTTDGSTNATTDGSTDGSTNATTDGSTNATTDGSTTATTDGSTDGSTTATTESSTDGSTNDNVDSRDESTNEDINQVQPYSTDLKTLQIDGNLTMTGQINASSYNNILIAADGKICIGDSCLTKDNIDKIMEMINN